MLKHLVYKNRSYRRFYEDVPITLTDLRQLIDLARHSPSGANKQPLKYMLFADPETNAVIFRSLAWAGYLKDWPGPIEGERPTGYILILGDTEISTNFGVDHGIAAQTMMLGATEMGFGGCILGAINRPQLREALQIPERYEILLVLALGRPKEQVVIEDVALDGDIKYYRDADQVHHVPKRTLDELILNED